MGGWPCPRYLGWPWFGLFWGIITNSTSFYLKSHLAWRKLCIVTWAKGSSFSQSLPGSSGRTRLKACVLSQATWVKLLSQRHTSEGESKGHEYAQRPCKYPAMWIRSYWIPTTILWEKQRHPKFMTEKTEVQKVILTSPRSHHQEGDDLIFLDLSSSLLPPPRPWCLSPQGLLQKLTWAPSLTIIYFLHSDFVFPPRHQL